MTNQEEMELSLNLRTMASTLGWQRTLEHINDEIKEGWDKFIDLPPEKKTSKNAFYFQAQYKVLKELKEWVQSSIINGDLAEASVRRDAERKTRMATTP